MQFKVPQGKGNFIVSKYIGFDILEDLQTTHIIVNLNTLV